MRAHPPAHTGQELRTQTSPPGQERTGGSRQGSNQRGLAGSRGTLQQYCPPQLHCSHRLGRIAHRGGRAKIEGRRIPCNGCPSFYVILYKTKVI